jgi:hypothetical protein
MSPPESEGKMKTALETLLRELARAATEDGAEYGVEVLDAVAAGWQAIAAAEESEVAA